MNDMTPPKLAVPHAASPPTALATAGASRADKPAVDMPRALPFLLNLLLATALGAYLGGWPAALAGAGAMFALLGAFFLAPRIIRARRALGRVGGHVWILLRPLVGLALLPPVAALALVASLLLFAWDRTLGLLERPSLAPVRAPVALLAHLRRLLTGLFSAGNLPMTAVNALLLLLLGCIAIGIQVAFYAALAAVPVLICTLMMVAVESSREPQDGPAQG